MKLFIIFIIASFCGASYCQYDNGFFTWLNYLRRGYNPYAYLESSGSADCPLECHCPSNFPTAMYCDSRKLKHIPYVPSRMKYVYFQNNQIASIQNGVFDNATGLIWIILHNNNLTSEQIDSKVFSKLKNLERLYLHHNKLTKIPTALPRSLKELQLSSNYLSSIPADGLEGLDNLTALYLNDNQLKDVGGALRGLSSLALLDLSNNKLKKLPENLPNSLNQLYLESNHVNTIPDEYFSKFLRLRYVRLSKNDLTDAGIPSNTFNSSSLIELDLSYNKLQKIPPVNPNLENLYLHANRIKEFSLTSFCKVIDIMNFSRIRVLRLDGNEIRQDTIPAEAPLCLRRAAIIDI
ncbi:fibromodulin [Protopterus annectens]|uniref:fibromodulin n=1 Tax=Protopterus annectens TaxID=7888 RepID=UPI001CFBF180|nr:fibromodulin [Protopterus annectens]